MAKEFTYTAKTGKKIFCSIEPNYVSKETVDKKVKDKTGQDPRLDRTIECTIRVVGEPSAESIGRHDKNKRMI